MSEAELIEKLRKLPEDLRDSVEKYVEELSKAHCEPTQLKAFGFSWKGALKDLGGQYNSVELQHLASSWR